MELMQLQCFVALAETLNFKRAAQRVFTSQSSMSRYIAGLESELQVPLFERGKSFYNTKLTAGGRYFLPRAKELLQSTQDLKDSMHQFSSEQFEQHALTIGIDTRLSHGFIPSYLYEYSKSLPYHLTLRTLEGEHLPEKLEGGEIDLGIAVHIDEKYLNRLSYQVLSKLPLMLYVHEDMLQRYPKEDPAEILRHEKIVTTIADVKINSHIMSLLYEMGIQPSFTFCETPFQIDFAVKTCRAVSILPETAGSVNHMVRQLPIPPKCGSLMVYALFPFDSADTMAIADHLKEKLNDHRFASG